MVRSILCLLTHDHILMCCCDVIYFRVLSPYEELRRGRKRGGRGGNLRLLEGAERGGGGMKYLFGNAQVRGSPYIYIYISVCALPRE